MGHGLGLSGSTGMAAAASSTRMVTMAQAAIRDTSQLLWVIADWLKEHQDDAIPRSTCAAAGV